MSIQYGQPLMLAAFLDVSNSRFSVLTGWAAHLMTDAPQLTPLRRDVFDLVKASARPIKAYELLALLSERRGRVTPPTVYRALNYLAECGLIHRIESLNAYAACAHAPAGPEHVFLICEACGEVSEVESADARIALDAASKKRNFLIHQVSIEVRGACRACGDGLGENLQ